MPPRPQASIQKAKRSLVKKLAGTPGFVGAGISVDASGRNELVVLVVEQASPVLAHVPREWEGFPVRTQIGGAPRKF